MLQEYLIYRGVRMLASLLPPMATIPARKYNDLMVKIVQGGV